MTTSEYLELLLEKGFQLEEDAIGFIYFGKHYTNASDEVTNAAIEITLKAQKTFDGSFYVSLLEWLVSNSVQTRQQALQFIKQANLISI